MLRIGTSLPVDAQCICHAISGLATLKEDNFPFLYVAMMKMLFDNTVSVFGVKNVVMGVKILSTLMTHSETLLRFYQCTVTKRFPDWMLLSVQHL